jgi:hypothetical protein
VPRGWPTHQRSRRINQLVICTARIGADDKSRPASPVISKSAGRGASEIYGGRSFWGDGNKRPRLSGRGFKVSNLRRSSPTRR